MIIASRISDRYNNRGWPSQFGWALMVIGFSIWLGSSVHNRAAHITALILAESGHYSEYRSASHVCPQLIGSLHPAHRHLVRQQLRKRVPTSRRRPSRRLHRPSRRVSFATTSSSAALNSSVGSGYLFPSKDSPKYTNGLIVEVALSVGGMIFTAIYQILIKWENAKRDKREGGPPAPGFRPDTATYADDAPGFRYIG